MVKAGLNVRVVAGKGWSWSEISLNLVEKGVYPLEESKGTHGLSGGMQNPQNNEVQARSHVS